MHSLCWVGRLDIISRLVAAMADWKSNATTNTAPLWRGGSQSGAVFNEGEMKGILPKSARSQKFAFAQRSGAIKAPVGLLSDRTVLRSKMEGPRPDKFAFAQRSGAIKAPVGLLSDRTVLRSKMEGSRPDKFAFAQRSGAMKAPVGLLSDRTVLRSKMEGPCPDKFHLHVLKPCKIRALTLRQAKSPYPLPA